MYKIIVHNSVFGKIDRYGDMFYSVFLSRFSDTGMWDAESLIQKQYLEASDLLVDTIVDKMLVTLWDFIYYTPLESWLRETSFRMWDRRIFLTYEEDEKSLSRYITDIEILRR